jgi:hypothetical protein
MKKRILSLLLAVITILQVIPAFTLPTIAEDETTGIDVADMEVGKLYKATWKYPPEALPDAGWILKGWYYGDRFGNGLQEVSSVGATVVDGKLIPRVVSEEDIGKDLFFWAIFIPTTLTITNSVDAGTAIPEWVTENQGFIYKIEGKPDTATEGISLTVAVPVGKTQTVLGLPLGEYNITLEGDWSWRYEQREQDSAFTMEANGTDLKYSYAAPSPDVGQDGYYITDGAYNDPTPKAEP